MDHEPKEQESRGPVGEEDVAALCAAASGGDQEALERLLWVHHHRFHSFARRKIGVDWQRRIDADDLLQEAYVEVFKAIATFEPRGEDAFYHWVTRIIDHRFVDQVRALRRKKRDVTREVGRGAASAASRDSLLERCLPDETTPSRIMRREDAVGALMGCIAQLPEDQRVVVERMYLNEEPAAQIAQEMGRTEDAIRGLATRAVANLRRGMGRASQFISRIG